MFIVLEGIDGVGKTTIAKLLAEYVTDMGYVVHNLREPGGSPIGESIRSLIKDSTMGAHLQPTTLAFLLNAARYENVVIIRQHLSGGGVVIADRYALSTIAYQRPTQEHVDLTLMGMSGVIPDLTIVLDADPRVLSQRRAADDNDWLDDLELEVKQRMREDYKIYASLPEFSKASVIVDASKDLADVYAAVTSAVDSLFNTPITT